MQYQQLLQKAYASFNARDIDTVLSLLQPNVHWSNGWEGGYVTGHDELREYWTRQWKEVDPIVEPINITQLPDGRVEVEVQQTVKDLQGTIVFDGIVKHIYTFNNGLIQQMDIEK
ncbi:nuclear transport factor 2 family protein [Ferruginibacter albus]|uniref:nuclear transport factor 2 family protein n=1 Tax=Ferruginibacter albus TaxID=2875540 RepID=UPI001CC4E502|nr:nuclear transport factor 2 family protein [Ferruginibacter albus]UAY52481.1 nuclear transport factor 2 family protein [Ferruginibacter albus]